MTSKKRFVKSLMAVGYSRNDTALLQQYAVNSIFSYPHIMYTAILIKIQGNKEPVRSTLKILDHEEAIILKSGKLRKMKPFSSIKPQMFGKNQMLKMLEKKCAAYICYAPKWKSQFKSFDEFNA